jgi:hypothetical protein
MLASLLLQVQDTLFDAIHDPSEVIEKSKNVILELQKTPLIDYADFTLFLLRFVFNFLVAFILVRVIYYPVNKKKDYLFTFFLFNTLIFMMCWMLASSKQGIGFAFGLFAVFSILRYRTEIVPVKEMAYFFICITIAVINAMATKKISYTELLFANGIILVLTFLLDSWIWRNLTNENMKEIMYERIDLITPENKEKMLEDLRSRTGLPVHRFEILRIDFLKDVAKLKAFYFSKEAEGTLSNQGTDDGD